ncbi:MAG: hypothetical protein WC243_00770 [Patescibacteria group bacterium]|jgi:hypothetical protein
MRRTIVDPRSRTRVQSIFREIMTLLFNTKDDEEEAEDGKDPEGENRSAHDDPNKG